MAVEEKAALEVRCDDSFRVYNQNGLYWSMTPKIIGKGCEIYLNNNGSILKTTYRQACSLALIKQIINTLLQAYSKISYLTDGAYTRYAALMAAIDYLNRLP